MHVGSAEELPERVRALEDQLRVVLPGDRDAAVQLDGLGRELGQGIGAVGLRDVGELAGVRRRRSTAAYDAAHDAERDISTSTSRSAIRCLSAWKEPMGRPNCTRSLE